MHPCQPCKCETIYKRHLDSKNDIQHATANDLAFLADADHGCSMIDRQSIASVLFTILGTIFHWKVICQPSVALHSTDAEMHGFCVGAKTIQHFCPLMEALGVPVHLTTPTGATPGCKTINLPLASSRQEK